LGHIEKRNDDGNLSFVTFSQIIILHTFRYTLFIVLYPIGVSGELACIYFSLAYVKEHQLLTVRMPNILNFTFDYQYFLIGTMLSYFPSEYFRILLSQLKIKLANHKIESLIIFFVSVFPQLYLHMFAQRKKILGGASVPSATTPQKKRA